MRGAWDKLVYISYEEATKVTTCWGETTFRLVIPNTFIRLLKQDIATVSHCIRILDVDVWFLYSIAYP
jgi:hypothetical protein